MSLWPAAIVLDGVTIPLDEVRADVQIHHGRTEVFAEPAASTCQIVFLEVTHSFVTGFEVGVELVITVSDGGAPVPRFTGRVTDATLDVDTLTVIATGKLSELGQYRVGLIDWPAETWTSRIQRVFVEAGLGDLFVMPGVGTFNPLLVARSAALGPVTLAEYLPQLIAMVGAAVADLPDGRILVQPLSSRGGTVTQLDPADVAYAPVWAQFLPAGNIVTVTYTPGDIISRAGTLTDASPVVTGMLSTLDLLVGMDVSGLGIPQDTRVQSVDSPTQITLSRSANISATKDGVIHPGETTIDELSDTSDLSVGMTVTAGGDLQGGTTIADIRSHDSVDISLASVGTHQGPFTFSAPAAAVLVFDAQTAFITARDEPSVALFGERPMTIDTTFNSVHDANQRAAERLARTAIPRWGLPAAPVLRGLELELGAPVELGGMPPASPATDWTALVEGWSETITGDDWTMELALSDPVQSGWIFSWLGIPAEWAWNELDPSAPWTAATTLGGITP